MTEIVLDNIIFSLQRTGGVSRFWSKLAERQIGNPEATFIERGNQQNLYRLALADMPATRLLSDHRVPLRIARYVDFRRRFSGARHIFHSSYYRSNHHPSAINVATVHDLIYEKFDRGIERAVHVWQKSRALRMADCLVCVSDATRQDLLHHYPFCARKRIEVIPNGVDPVVAAPAGTAAGTDGRYLLYVGHRGTCKGFDRTYPLLKALQPDVRCLVVGAPFSAEEIRAIDAHGLRDRIRNMGRVDDATLHALYANSAFFFFPSLYEGFGIPPIEAMQHHCPVLATDRSSVPEVVGDAALMFDPDDVPTMIAHARALLAGKGVAELRRRGAIRAEQLAWRHALDRYQALYDDLMQKAR